MINACERRKVECGQEVHVGARQEDLGLGNRKKMVEVEQLYCFHDVLKICQVRWMYLSTIISDTDINAEGCRALFLESIAVSGFLMLVMPPPAQLTPKKWGTLSWVPLLQALLGSVAVLLVANFWRSASTEEGSQEKMLLHVPEPLRLSLSLRIWKSLEVPSLHIFAPLWSLGPKSQSLRWWFSICVWRSARFGTQCRAVVSWNTEGK